VLFHSDARQPSITLVLTRQRSALTAQIDGLETVAATKWLTADAEIRFTVRETANQKIVLYLPALDGFALKEGDKVRKQARYRDILVDGQRLETSPRTALPFEVDAHRGRPVVLAIRGIEDADEYSGTIRLSSADGSPVTKDVTVLVKTSGSQRSGSSSGSWPRSSCAATQRSSGRSSRRYGGHGTRRVTWPRSKQTRAHCTRQRTLSLRDCVHGCPASNAASTTGPPGTARRPT
jgi:hypothetical protein